MSARNNKCESCIGPNGECVDSLSSFNDLQGQINACPSQSGWNYKQNALFQLRNMPAPAHSFLATTNPMSFDLANPERYRPLTHMPQASQKLTNGSFKLNSDALGHQSWLYRSTLDNVSKLNMYAQIPSGNLNSNYCGPEFHNCFYKAGITRAGPAHDGCVPLGTPCGQALSGI
jgi:hypothetical protein